MPCRAHLRAELDRVTEDRRAAGGPVMFAKTVAEVRGTESCDRYGVVIFFRPPAGEGVMLRRPGSKYKGGRSHDLLKVKKSLDDEAVVVGYKPGKGRCQAYTHRSPKS